MIDLIKFSVKRKFLNKTSFMFNILILTVVTCLFNFDRIINIINPEMLDPLKISISENVNKDIKEYLMNAEQTNFIFIDKEADYTLDFKDNYILKSEYAMNLLDFQVLSNMLNMYKQEKMLMENGINPESMQPISIIQDIKNSNKDNTQVVLIVITAIYFMALSFALGASGEIVYEKSTRTLELILTSVSSKVHFISKILASWITVIIQCLISGSFIGINFIIRNLNDQGIGLLKILNKMQVITPELRTFQDIFKSLNLNSEVYLKLIISLIFLFLGIICIQMFMIILSSFVSSMEEASNIQAPFYMILMGVYYLSITLNTPTQMNEGIGYIFSFVPVLSMLFMPCRMISTNVGAFDIITSLSITLLLLFILYKYGSKLYQKGVLNYSKQGILKKIKNKNI